MADKGHTFKQHPQATQTARSTSALRCLFVIAVMGNLLSDDGMMIPYPGQEVL
jgi:hypothetical protein